MIHRGLGADGSVSLMPILVQDVLMVASPYDVFILEEDGRFSDRMFKEYAELDLASPPHFEHVTSGKAALDRLEKKHFDLVLTTPHCSDMSPGRLAQLIGMRYKDIPVTMLTYDRAEALNYARAHPSSKMRVFVWNGDPKLLIALVKISEDMRNVADDTEVGLVRVILVVEDSPTDYSVFLPVMYREIMAQLHLLMPDRLNHRDRHNRMRARPKILLARTYEEAAFYLRRYHKFLLGVISDVRFPRSKVSRAKAGITLVRRVRKYRPEIPILLQSFETEHREIADRLGIAFADKRSEEFLRTVRRFMKHHFGFGDFIFRLPNGEKVARAKNLESMVKVLKRVPKDSLEYHARLHHISNWLFARSEFSLALEIQPRVVEEFKNMTSVRRYLISAFTQFIEERQRGQVSDFSQRTNLLTRDFTRIDTGSMGGKARGVAFVSHLLAASSIHEKFPGIRIMVPRAAVICTDFFDNYCARHDLSERALECKSDEEVVRLFLDSPLDRDMNAILTRIISQVRYPLAVRSSSLLEDSTFQPLAGLYRTIMLANCSPSKKVRLQQLSRAVRLVVASSFFRKARKYLESHGLRPEQEKMAVLIQRLVGHRFGDRFYPDFAGVAQSYNYYPMSFMKPEDGIATMALGLGQTVVEGSKAYRFCLRHPLIQPSSSPVDVLRSSQRRFYGLDLSNQSLMPKDSGANILRYDLDTAREDGTLDAVGATFSPENNVIYDTIYRKGAHLVNFSGVLKYDRFPLTDLLSELVEVCRKGMGSPVELEFAVALDRDGHKAEMAILELRPLIAMSFEREVNLAERKPNEQLILESRALGNGIIGNLRDIVYIHPDRLNFAQSAEVAQEIERFNHRLCKMHRPYVLLGPGRWGTADHWLGIPVKWNQVSGARAIVEMEIPNKPIDPSQGTHFFHNLISLRVGYFSVNLGRDHFIDFDWLEGQPVEQETHGIRHLVLKKPIEARIDGRTGKGIIINSATPGQ